MCMAMIVPMVNIRIVRMPVNHRRMSMPMGVRHARWDGKVVIMLMVLIVTMAMLMLHRFMRMLMIVSLSEM